MRLHPILFDLLHEGGTDMEQSSC